MPILKAVKTFHFRRVKIFVFLFIFSFMLSANKPVWGGMTFPQGVLFLAPSAPRHTGIGRPFPPSYISITPGYKQAILVWGMPINVKKYKEEYYGHFNRGMKRIIRKGKTREALLSNEESNIMHYNIYRAKRYNGHYLKVGFTNTTSYTITSLTNGKAYCFEVTEQNSFGESARSKPACSTPQDIYITAREPWGITADGSGNIWISNVGSNNVTKFRIGNKNLSPNNMNLSRRPMINLGTYGASGLYTLAVVGTYEVGNKPMGIKTDYAGNIWVVNNGSNSVTKLNPDGKVIGTYAVGKKPLGIAIDVSGNVWVTNNGSNSVTKLNPDGKVIGTYAVGKKPFGIAIDASGNVWVANNGGYDVTKLSPTGTLAGSYNVGHNPRGIATDMRGNIWVTASMQGHGHVFKLTADGVMRGDYSIGNNPVAVVVDDAGNIWVVNNKKSIFKLNQDGTIINTYNIGVDLMNVTVDLYGSVFVLDHSRNYSQSIIEITSRGFEENIISNANHLAPFSIAVDHLNNIWMANIDNNTVSQLGPEGNIIGIYPVGIQPRALAIDATGNVWVANHDGSTVTKLSAAGVTLGTYHIPGLWLEDIAIDAQGNAWVVSGGSKSVMKLSPDGALMGKYIVGIGPANLVIDTSGNLWVALYEGKAVVEVNPTGTIANLFEVDMNPLTIAIGPSGSIWVGSARSRKVIQLRQPESTIESGGFPIRTYHDTYRGYCPAGMAVDALGNLWLANKGSRQVTELDRNGDLVGAYNMPVGFDTGRIAIDGSGNVFITHPKDGNFTEIVGVTKGPQYSPYNLSQNLSFTIPSNPIGAGYTATATVTPFISERNALRYTWSATPGWVVIGNGTTATVIAPRVFPYQGTVSVSVTNTSGTSVSSSVSVSTGNSPRAFQE